MATGLERHAGLPWPRCTGMLDFQVPLRERAEASIWDRVAGSRGALLCSFAACTFAADDPDYLIPHARRTASRSAANSGRKLCAAERLAACYSGLFPKNHRLSF